MCEYCEGRRFLTEIEDNSGETVMYGAYCGTRTSMHACLVGRDLQIGGHMSHRTAADAYYDDDNDHGVSANIGGVVRIKYCPMCGRKLEGPEFDIIDLKRERRSIENSMYELERKLKDLDPVLRFYDDGKGVVICNVAIYPGKGIYETLECHKFKLRDSVYRSRLHRLYEAVDDEFILSSTRPEFPLGEFLEGGAVVKEEYQTKAMQITPANLRVLMTAYPVVTRKPGQLNEFIPLTEEMIQAHENEVRDSMVQMEAFKHRIEEIGNEIEDLTVKLPGTIEIPMDRGCVADLISGFFTTHQWNAYYEQDYCMGSLGPEPGLNIERLRTDVEAYIDRAGATNH